MSVRVSEIDYCRLIGMKDKRDDLHGVRILLDRDTTSCGATGALARVLDAVAGVVFLRFVTFCPAAVGCAGRNARAGGLVDEAEAVCAVVGVCAGFAHLVGCGWL